MERLGNTSMKKNIYNRIDIVASFVTVLSIIVILLVTSIDINCFNKKFFASEYASLHTAQDLGMSDKDLNKATNTLLDYLQEKRQNIDVVITLKGTKQEAFNSKEKAHMVDVRGLYQFAVTLRKLCLILFVIGFIYLLARLKKGAITILSIDYMKISIVFAVVFAILAIWAFTDFDNFWTAFHKIAFRNNLWLLDPNTDLMINLFPSQFFSALVFRIIGMFASVYILLFVGSYLYLRVRLKRMHNGEEKGGGNE